MKKALYVMFLLAISAPAHASIDKEQLCRTGAAVVLRETSVDDANTGQETVACRCDYAQKDYDEYMRWCLQQASPGELNEMEESIKTSPCATTAPSHCVRE